MLYINSSLKSTLAALKGSLPHAVLLSGQSGVGLFTMASAIAADHISAEIEVIRPEQTKTGASSISVATIRELYVRTRAKRTTEQIVIIDDVDTMSESAQNAFLKLLEEPNDLVRFILLSHQPAILLSTVRSRLQRFEIKPISSAQSAHLLDAANVTDNARRTQLLFLADGLPAELFRLLASKESFTVRATLMKDARQLLQASTYEKLVLVRSYVANRQKATALIEAMIMLTTKAMTAHPSQATLAQLEHLEQAYVRLRANGHIKLTLATLVV